MPIDVHILWFKNSFLDNDFESILFDWFLLLCDKCFISKQRAKNDSIIMWVETVNRSKIKSLYDCTINVISRLNQEMKSLQNYGGFISVFCMSWISCAPMTNTCVDVAVVSGKFIVSRQLAEHLMWLVF